MGIRTYPWETGWAGTSVSPWIAYAVPMKNTGLYISPSGTVSQPGMKAVVVKLPAAVQAIITQVAQLLLLPSWRLERQAARSGCALACS